MRTIINLNTGWKFINHDVGLVDCDPVDWQDKEKYAAKK